MDDHVARLAMDMEMEDKVEALLQNTLAHVTQVGCSKETRRRMKQRLHRRLDLLVKGDRHEYDRNLQRFHQMLEQAKPIHQTNTSRRSHANAAQELRRYRPNLAMECYAYQPQSNYVYLQSQRWPGSTGLQGPLIYDNLDFGRSFGQEPGWNPWSGLDSPVYRGAGGSWDYMGDFGAVLPATMTELPVTSRRRSRSLPRTRLRPAAEFTPMLSSTNPMRYADVRQELQICEAALAAAETSFDAGECKEELDMPKFESASAWLDAGLNDEGLQ